jgi:hypothetical protein
MEEQPQPLDSPNQKNRYSLFLMIGCFLFFNVSTFLSIGWGGSSNLELGWIFIGPMLIVINFLFSLVTLLYLSHLLRKNRNPEIIFWSLFTAFISNFLGGFYIDNYHNPFLSFFNPFLSIGTAIVIFSMIVTFVFSLIALNKDPILFKKFKNKLIIILIFFTICSSGFLTYSIHYQDKKEEEGRQFEQMLIDRETKDKKDWEDALSSAYKIIVSLNGKAVPDAGLYFKIIKRDPAFLQNRYIYTDFPDEGDDLRLESDRVPPGDYMFAPLIIRKHYDCNVISLGRNPNLNVSKLIFRGPYHMGGKILDINIEITNSEYQTLLKMQAPPGECGEI